MPQRGCCAIRRSGTSFSALLVWAVHIYRDGAAEVERRSAALGLVVELERGSRMEPSTTQSSPELRSWHVASGTSGGGDLNVESLLT